MNRPLYETEADLQREQEVAELVGLRFNCDMHKLAKRYVVDYIATRGDNKQGVAFCEIKGGNHTWEDYQRMGGFRIALHKWAYARFYCEASNLPFLFVAAAADGAWYRPFADFSHQYTILYSGRTDRNDPQDMDPCMVLPCDTFKLLTK
jgi:hypothetical protein